MVIVEDGKGSGLKVAVSNNNRLDVSARVAPRTYYESRDNGTVYAAHYVDAGFVANEETAYLQNTSTIQDVMIDAIFIGSAAAAIWRLKFVTGTATGTVVIPTNLNKTSSNSAAANCRGGAAGVSGLTDGDTIAIFRNAGPTVKYSGDIQGLRLGQNDAIAIEAESSGDGEITILFHFDSE